MNFSGSYSVICNGFILNSLKLSCSSFVFVFSHEFSLHTDYDLNI